ncbi:MAG: hypothetical protein A2Z16_16095 [Chloroflexi bacterium RBG_16_54_18]|nr:MAG: hypothetical protein A2Z16_16095 [Chloroflexi bacterium RBG_16_54_18]
MTGQLLYEVAQADSARIQQVYRDAHRVQLQVAALTVQQRVLEMVKISDYLLAHQEELLERLVCETGKTRFDALSTELFEICDLIDTYRDSAPRILADRTVHTPLVLMGKKSKVVFEPLGVVLVIVPWNYPLYQGLVPSLLAFLAGNAVILKPSENSPLEGMLESILEGSGFFPAAIQVVYGDRQVGEMLVEGRPDKIHFTGSQRGGRQVLQAAAKNLVPVDLELGGKDPAIVFEDVNIEKTANGVVWAAFTHAGQSCTSIERCYVQKSIYTSFLAEVLRIVENLRLSASLEQSLQVGESDIGCLTVEFQAKIIEDQLKDAVEKGARILAGGSREPGSLRFPPTVVVDLKPEMKLLTEETFGPVLPLVKFTTEAEAVQLANDTPYGLSASVWSKDLRRAERVARALQVGNVSINNHMLTEGNASLPFGGVKSSGFGRYKGEWGLHTFCNIKAIMLGPNDKAIEPHWYPQSAAKYALFNRLEAALFRRPRSWLKFLSAGLALTSQGNKEKIR